ncbi:unnamed protein product [Bemisia tabaci]|uniref:Uncharacterized protein n=1 Tax=Bemisia tabaci TaxID=7038 RepID=A0A9P0F8G3_BEMTA|nr:unnamed protein product [Bemisia tabaci]
MKFSHLQSSKPELSRHCSLVGSASQTIGHIVSKIIDEFKIKDLGLSLGGSRAQVDPHAFVSLLEGDILVIEDRTPSWDPKGDEDRLFRLTEQLVAGERSFETTLRSAKEIYAGSSHRLEFFIEEDYRLIFDNVSDLADASHEFSQQMADVLKNWETDAKQIVGYTTTENVSFTINKLQTVNAVRKCSAP